MELLEEHGMLMKYSVDMDKMQMNVKMMAKC